MEIEFEYFRKYKKPCTPERSVVSLTNRWTAIPNTFCMFLFQIESMHPNVVNEQARQGINELLLVVLNYLNIRYFKDSNYRYFFYVFRFKRQSICIVKTKRQHFNWNILGIY